MAEEDELKLDIFYRVRRLNDDMSQATFFPVCSPKRLRKKRIKSIHISLSSQGEESGI
jgi:hypothetical protein